MGSRWWVAGGGWAAPPSQPALGWPLVSARIRERRADPCGAPSPSLFQGWEAPRRLLLVVLPARPLPRPPRGQAAPRGWARETRRSWAEFVMFVFLQIQPAPPSVNISGPRRSVFNFPWVVPPDPVPFRLTPGTRETGLLFPGLRGRRLPLPAGRVRRGLCVLKPRLVFQGTREPDSWGEACIPGRTHTPLLCAPEKAVEPEPA